MCSKGGPEVKFQIATGSAAYREIAVVDFVRNDDGPEGILFEPETILTFDRIEGQIGHADLVIDALRWDAVVIRHDVSNVESSLAGWFEEWFDPEEIRYNVGAEVTGCIHALYFASQELHVDFGTAPVEAFWELLDCLANGGGRKIIVST